MRQEAGGSAPRIRELITKTPRLGPVGAGIFCREAQQVWPELRPYFDDRVLKGARTLGLPGTSEGLAELVAQKDFARLSAALVRVALDDGLADSVRSGVRHTGSG